MKKQFILSIILLFFTSLLKAQQNNIIINSVLPTVRILADSFYIPQLNRNRIIRICLPIDYNTNLKRRYPVIYMHDGQNLFDKKTSFAGEWGIDECLDSLQKLSGKGFIVVGIDNGGDKRIDELTPWPHKKYGGGEGAKYIDFITQTLKPFIDKKYRTLPKRENTIIGGSSLGGLISVYAAFKYPEVYGKVINFSPAYWINLDSIKMYIHNRPLKYKIQIYSYAGEKEGKEMIDPFAEMEFYFKEAGIKEKDRFMTQSPDGEHKEFYWRREFPKAIVWLFNIK
ncbi:MAG: alpha/beta hydrolase [Bacteroidetes bacterium]|nr:alpha/beta hydrolase [Bacteroidota bacterium]